MKLDGKRALVTGASSGIGRAIAHALAKKGVQLAIAARRTSELESLAEEIASDGEAAAKRPIVLTADLSKPGEAARLAETARAALGEIELLVSNAGVNITGRQEDLGDADEARAMFETNYWSPLALTRALLPSMRAKNQGAIVNVTSLASLTPLPKDGHYASTKAALSLATEALRMELASTAIQVLNVLPGPVATAMFEAPRVLGPEFGKMMDRSPRGTPDGLARRIVSALERRRARVVYPASYAFVRRFPNFSLWAAHRLAPRYA